MEPQEKIDWTAARDVALECLESTHGLICWAEWAQQDKYDDNLAAEHLKAIVGAVEALRHARRVFQPTLRVGEQISRRYSDPLTLATKTMGPRPACLCYASAHETAVGLLRRAIGWVEANLIPLNLDIRSLHGFSAESLHATLRGMVNVGDVQNILSDQDILEIRKWIEWEWAATVSLQASVEPAGASANSANTSRLFLGVVPDNTDLRDLALQLDAEKSKPEAERRSKNAIARNFTGETIGKDKKARSLLAQLRRMTRQGRVNL